MPRNSRSTPGQVQLPGQAATPDGPVDLTAMLVMHWAFRRDLDRFVAAVTRTPVEDRAAWRTLTARWELFRRILHDHHTGEDDGLWPALLGRLETAGSPEGREVLAAMAAEHHGIDPLLDSIAEGLSRMAAAADDDTHAAIGVRMVAARERLTQHLGHEERDALALVQQHLSPGDWERISKTYFERTKNPREIAVVVAWVMHDLPDAAAARLLAGAAPLRVLWRVFLRRPFARRERRAFRYAS
jgi:hemerythrin-like domain-containing protein